MNTPRAGVGIFCFMLCSMASFAHACDLGLAFKTAASKVEYTEKMIVPARENGLGDPERMLQEHWTIRLEAPNRVVSISRHESDEDGFFNARFIKFMGGYAIRFLTDTNLDHEPVTVLAALCDNKISYEKPVRPDQERVFKNAVKIFSKAKELSAFKEKMVLK
jgi:hypothetical protein